MKIRWVFGIMLFSLVLSAASAYGLTEQELKSKLSNQQELNSLGGKLNNVMEQVPSQLKSFFGTDETYHVRIGSSNLGVYLKGGKVSKITTTTPTNPTRMADTDYATIVEIANSGNPAGAVANALIKGKIKVYRIAPCGSDQSCRDNEVCTMQGCKLAFTVVVVPLNYGSGDKADFLDKAVPELDIMADYLPADRIRVHYVDPAVCPSFTCKDGCTDCQTKALECARKAGLSSVADKIVGINKNDVVTYWQGEAIPVCGCAGGIPSQTDVVRSRLCQGGGCYCVTSVVHEVGHSLGLYHVNSAGNEGGACQGINAKDCQDQNKNSDIMGYMHPRNHFGPAADAYIKNLLKGYSG